MSLMTDTPDSDRAASPAAVGVRAPASSKAKADKPLRPRVQRRPVHGVLLLDKPLGWTSNDALQKAKGILRAEKAGHTGTLDPLATGLLPLCFGAATKFSQVSLDSDKTYLATLQLGQTRVGGDREGEVLEERPVQCDRAAVEAACARFLGAIDQMPPMHSALKHQGKALYEYARAGVEIERPTRRITIHRLDIIDWQAHAPDRLVIEVCSSKGTYIRSLAEDIGRALGCGAHLAALRRIASGPLNVVSAVTLEALQAMSEAERDALLASPDRLLAEWPRVELGAEDASRFLCGMRRRIGLPDAADVRVYGPDGSAFLGSAHITAGELIADRLLSPLEVQALLPVAALPTPNP